MTQKELAQKLNLTDATLNRYEKGHRKPDPKTLSKIAEILHVSVDWLLGRTDHPEPLPNFEKFLKKMVGRCYTRRRIFLFEGVWRFNVSRWHDTGKLCFGQATGVYQ